MEPAYFQRIQRMMRTNLRRRKAQQRARQHSVFPASDTPQPNEGDSLTYCIRNDAVINEQNVNRIIEIDLELNKNH